MSNKLFRIGCLIRGHHWTMIGENRIVYPPIRLRRCGRCGTIEKIDQ